MANMATKSRKMAFLADSHGEEFEKFAVLKSHRRA